MDLNSSIAQFMVTKDSWHGYTETHVHSGFLDYIEATEDFINVLEGVLANSKSFKEMKENLTALTANRKDFVKFAGHHLP